MPVPKPGKNEDKNKFIGRCVKFLMDEDSNRDQKQAVAICYGAWRNRGEIMVNEKLDFIVPIQESMKTEGDFLIKGVAINETTTRNGITYLAEELESSAITLKNKPILKDHNNSIDSIVGRTTNNVTYNNVGKNIVFEGKIMDKKVQEMIEDGRVTSVSVGAMVKNIEEQKNDDDNIIARIVRGIEFVELSLVAVPADPNAGFALAIAEKFDNKTKEGMKINEEIKEDKKADEVKVDIKEDKMEETKEVAQAKDESTEQIKALEEENKKLKIEVLKREQEELKKKLEVEKKTEEKPKDETKGEVVTVEEKRDDGLFIGRDSECKGMAIYRENYNDSKFKRLRRE